MKSSMNNKAGTTFLEVLIALFIFTLMVSAVFPVFLSTRKMDLYSKVFTEARQMAQTRIEWIYSQSQSYGYLETLYQLSTAESYTCDGFTWTVDSITSDILFNEPSSVVTCTKTTAPFIVELIFTKNDAILTEDFFDIKITVNDIRTSTTIKLYETLYATGFIQ
jgi:Tfp pilus assembly protein PilV